MATISVTIPDVQLARVVDALVGGDAAYGQSVEGMNPKPTKGQWAQQQVIDHIKNVVRAYEAALAARTAAVKSDSEVSVS